MSADEYAGLGPSGSQRRTVAVIPAAGEGRRMGAGVEKQFLSLAGMPLVCHCLKVFEASPLVHGVVMVVPQERVEWVWENVVRAMGFSKVFKVLSGGPTRQDSVWIGLQGLGEGWDLVVIHDGARPFLKGDVLERALREAWTWGACVAAVPVKDTVKEVGEDATVLRTLPREALWLIQTPQAFRYGLILEAYTRAAREGITATDDSTLVEIMGWPVKITMGSYENVKITTPEDLALAEGILRKG